jgi:hypothetical protein
LANKKTWGDGVNLLSSSPFFNSAGGNKMKPSSKKLQLTPETEILLGHLVIKANENFKGSVLTKNDLLNWGITYFAKHSFEKAIPDLQKDHLKPIFYLQTVLSELRQAEKEETPVNLAALLEPLIKGQ